MSDLTNLKKLATKTKEYVDSQNSTINTALASEISARKSGDTTLQTNIDTEVTRAKGVESGLNTRLTTTEKDIDTIESKIPTEASSTNQLADKDFVNSSISTATATFRGTKETKAEIKLLKGDLNDYCYLVVKDSTTGLVKQYDRYKYTDEVSTETGNWVFEYTLNNSSFTAEQWASITSGITSALVTQIGTNKTNIATNTSNLSSHTSNKSNPHSVTKAQVGLGNVANTGDSATPTQNGTTKFTTGGAYTLKQSIDTNTTNITNEIANRQQGDKDTLTSAKTYTNDEVTKAKTYAEGLFATDSEVTTMLTEVFGS